MNEPLKIAIASSGLGHVTRGIEAWAEDLAAELYAHRAAVTLYKGGGIAMRSYEQVVPCLQRHSLRNGRVLDLVPKRFFWRFGFGSPFDAEQTTFTAGLIRRLRRQPADVAHVQDPMVALILQRAFKLGLTRTPVILGHGTNEPLSFLKKIRFLQHLAPSHRDEASQAGVDHPDGTVIPNFVDTTVFAPGTSQKLRAELKIPPDAVIALCVSSVDRAGKRIDHLIRAFAQVPQTTAGRPAYLVIAGARHVHTDELLSQAEQMLGDRVRFLLDIPRPRMPEVYRVADVFVMSALKEMMSIALTEAVACGLPCVVHPHPVMQWIVGPGGVYVDMTKEANTANGLIALLSDVERRRSLGALGRDHAVEQFSKDAVINQLLAYYSHVVSAAAGRTREAVSCA
jgi:glycosyltransferase involved in cell wall biosynthesis